MAGQNASGHFDEDAVAGYLADHPDFFERHDDLLAQLKLPHSTGGAVFSVVNEDEIAKAAVAHRNSPWQIASIKAAGLSDIMIAGRPTHLYPGQRVTLVARGALDHGGTTSRESAEALNVASSSPYSSGFVSNTVMNT